MNLQASSLNTADLPAVAALQPADWGSIMAAHEMYIRSPYCFPFKFIQTGKVVGIGTIIIHDDSAWLAHIIVHPDARKQGIGGSITKTLMDNAFSRNCNLLSLIATEAGEPVYTRLGFETDTEYIFFKDVKPGTSVLPCENIVPLQPAFVEKIIKIDKYITGENREAYLRDHIANGEIYLKNNTVEGYYLPDAGEGLIAAITSSAGLALVEQRIKKCEVCIFPVHNDVAKQYFEVRHYNSFRTAKHMVYGKRRTWHPAHIFNRIGGNLG